MPSIKPRVFIGSSSSSVDRGIVDDLRSDLSEFAEVVAWTKLSEFKTQNTTLASLIEAANTFDFAILVLANDDKVIRGAGAEQNAPRDNVILELGLFLGAIGHDRVVPIMEKGCDLLLPSDIGTSINVPRFSTENAALQRQDIAAISESFKVRTESKGRREIKLQLAHQWWFDTATQKMTVRLSAAALQRNRSIIGERELAIVSRVKNEFEDGERDENIAVSALRKLPAQISDNIALCIPASDFPVPPKPGDVIATHLVMAPPRSNLLRYKSLLAMWESGIHRVEPMTYSVGKQCHTEGCSLGLGPKPNHHT